MRSIFDSMLKAVILNLDGVLVNSEAHICHAGIKMFREKGFRVDEQDFTEFTGMGENKYLGGVAEKHHIPLDLEKDKHRTYSIYTELVRGELTPLGGVIDFLAKCRERKFLIVLASSADPIKIKTILHEIDMDTTEFHGIISGIDFVKKKPSPDIFLTAARRLGVRPKECLVVEDALSGVLAGIDAGARILALTTNFPEHELLKADWILPTLADVDEEILNW
jgi:beta-phosphoglucomutase